MDDNEKEEGENNDNEATTDGQTQHGELLL